MAVKEKPWVSQTSKASALRSRVDELGSIKARIATLEEQEQELRDEIAASGDTEIEGRLFRATVSTSLVVKTNLRAVVDGLPPSGNLTRLVNKNTTTEERTTVKVVSR